MKEKSDHIKIPKALKHWGFLIGTFQGSLQNFISNCLTLKGESMKDYIHKNNQVPTGYFQIGISIDLFVGKKKQINH